MAESAESVLTRLREAASVQEWSGAYLADTLFEGPHLLAVDRTLEPSILFLLSGSNAGASARALSFEHIRMVVVPSAEIQVLQGATAWSSAVACVSCTSQSREVQQAFLRVLAPIAGSCTALASADHVLGLLEQASELLRALAASSSRSLQGFWAELLLIAECAAPAKFVEAWHVHPRDLFDFAADDEVIEVKSTSRRRRSHIFSLEQVQGSGSARPCVIASVMLEEGDLGETCIGLMSEIATSLSDPQHLLKLERVALSSLGSSYRLIDRTRFLRSPARSSLLLLPAFAIPCPGGPLPPEVTQVRFVSDLTRLSPAPFQRGSLSSLL